MMHGYNNTQQAASDSYYHFLANLGVNGSVSRSLVGIYWPGANWEGGLYYMQALGQAKATALVLAKSLYQIAQAKGYLTIDIVTHSLGARLALETVKAMLALQQTEGSPSPLVIGRITMMAGAVPVAYLAQSNELQMSLPPFRSTQSLYSLQDMVLHWAFPAGETAAGEGFFPVALGRKKWAGGSVLVPNMNQQENVGANHGDYWGADSKNTVAETFAANQVYNFLDIGPGGIRQVSARVLPIVAINRTRTTISGRTLPVRTM